MSPDFTEPRRSALPLCHSSYSPGTKRKATLFTNFCIDFAHAHRPIHLALLAVKIRQDLNRLLHEIFAFQNGSLLNTFCMCLDIALWQTDSLPWWTKPSTRRVQHSHCGAQLVLFFVTHLTRKLEGPSQQCRGNKGYNNSTGYKDHRWRKMKMKKIWLYALFRATAQWVLLPFWVRWPSDSENLLLGVAVQERESTTYAKGNDGGGSSGLGHPCLRDMQCVVKYMGQVIVTLLFDLLLVRQGMNRSWLARYSLPFITLCSEMHPLPSSPIRFFFVKLSVRAYSSFNITTKWTPFHIHKSASKPLSTPQGVLHQTGPGQ